MDAAQRLRLCQERLGTRLCVGLDPDPASLPTPLRNEPKPWHRFLREIISATAPFACAYKLNLAFYQQFGAEGWELLEYVRGLLPDTVVCIGDGKFADVPHTSGVYARTYFDRLGMDALTLSPYLGRDALEPFLERSDKLLFVLVRTSNPGAGEFQLLPTASGAPLYLHIAMQALQWERRAQLGFVVGASAPQELAELRRIAPGEWVLVPGIGAQGGNPADVLAANGDAPLLVTVGRAILYASTGTDFAEAAHRSAYAYAQQVGFPTRHPMP
jgi:orotidine-5'-phosphate decarboxylase